MGIEEKGKVHVGLPTCSYCALLGLPHVGCIFLGTVKIEPQIKAILVEEAKNNKAEK